MASPTLTRSRPEPAAVATARNLRARTQVRAQWLVLAAALTVLAGVLVAWAIERAADRVDVVSVARPVPAGTVIQADDLTTTAIAFDQPVVGLAPASSLDALVGRVAVVELRPGTLLSAGMWADGTGLSPDERTVGALLDVGTHPSGLATGATALAIAIDDAAGSPSSTGSTATDGVLVRVLDTRTADRGALQVTLAVPEADAARIARLAAAQTLVLVGVPATPDATPLDTPTPTPDAAADTTGADAP
ncbi:MAG: SAF domain-containing protein [Actinobacteria bacterium]|nr:SAF domain-containing protein [Actinomycetota bacterium]